MLRRSTLDELGGAQQIVHSHLHSVLNGLTPEHREIAAKAFRLGYRGVASVAGYTKITDQRRREAYEQRQRRGS